jgi:DnaJ-domain-containing protein 1
VIAIKKNPEYENFSKSNKRLLTVPKAEIDKRHEEWKSEIDRKHKPKKATGRGPSLRFWRRGLKPETRQVSAPTTLGGVVA